MKYAMHMAYSDINPYEVIRVVSDKCIEVREMKAKLNPKYKPEFVPGGFSAICLNGFDQEWIIEPDESRPIIRIRANKKLGWACKDGRRFSLNDKPVKYYDYNF
jgi:hypothetical protein